MLKIPAFDETHYTDHQENDAARVVSFPAASQEQFEAYCRLLQEQDFIQKEVRGGYAAYQKGGTGVFLNFYETTGELRIVMEENCRYFDYTDICGKPIVRPQITQLHLEDFGMSYAIRLSDGRFVLIDGGNIFSPDAERLFACLKEGSPFEKPVIAAWIMTHPHSDHFHNFFTFYAHYGKEVVIEKFLFNFPEADDLAHYPKLAQNDARFPEPTAGTVRIPAFWKLVKESGTAVYMPHTGQTYRIGDAVFEVLSSIDDTIHCSQNINATSLVLRMELSGQVTLWAADASFEDARLPERYGEYLRADILQVPHHGFGSGSMKAQINGFDLIRPETCLLPVSDYNAYLRFSAFKEGTRHLMTDPGIAEMITGSKTRTITLPYTPPSYAARQLRQKYEEGQASAGAKAWYFTDLSTGRAEDFIFTVINPVVQKANLIIELYFEDPKRNINFITTTLGSGMYRFSVIDPAQVETESEYFNPNSLQKKGIPENAVFAVRFLSDSPVVISHRDHPAAYRH